jgi:hypothetical protein
MQHRGRNELDSYEPQGRVDLECLYQPSAVVGDLCKIVDAGYGPVIYGKITGIEHRAIPGGALTRVSVLRAL